MDNGCRTLSPPRVTYLTLTVGHLLFLVLWGGHQMSNIVTIWSNASHAHSWPPPGHQTSNIVTTWSNTPHAPVPDTVSWHQVSNIVTIWSNTPHTCSRTPSVPGTVRCGTSSLVAVNQDALVSQYKGWTPSIEKDGLTTTWCSLQPNPLSSGPGPNTSFSCSAQIPTLDCCRHTSTFQPSIP